MSRNSNRAFCFSAHLASSACSWQLILHGHGDFTALTRAELDLSDIDAVRAAVRAAAPAIVINAAAYTAVDKAESEPEIARSSTAPLPQRLPKSCLQPPTAGSSTTPPTTSSTAQALSLG
jgi:hypothetical protein